MASPQSFDEGEALAFELTVIQNREAPPKIGYEQAEMSIQYNNTNLNHLLAIQNKHQEKILHQFSQDHLPLRGFAMPLRRTGYFWKSALKSE